MVNKFKQRKQAGFTIVEVMIVLAIAALILLVVLLAVPALQRNSRNTAIRNDASTVAGAISTYSSNNGGTPVAFASGQGANAQVGISSTDTNREKVNVQGTTTVTTTGTAPSGTGKTATNKTPIGRILIVPSKQCSGTANSRSYQLWFAVEVSGGTNQQCQDASS